MSRIFSICLCLSLATGATACCDVLSEKLGLSDKDETDSDTDDETDESPSKSKKKSKKKAKKEAKKPKKTHPIEFEWPKDKEFVIKGAGDPKQKGEVMVFESHYRVTLKGFPEGTEWSVGDKKGKVESKNYSIKVADVTDKVGSVELAKKWDAKIDPEATLKLVLPDGGAGEVKLKPAGVGLSVETVLKKAENGPALFGSSEPPDDKPRENVYFMDGFTTSKVIGRANLARDIDTVAFAHLLPDVKDTKKCTGYKSNDGKAMPDLELQLKEAEVKIHDRRTGNVLEKKTFPPDKDCPMFTFRKAGENKQDSSIPRKAIEAWLRTQIK